MLCAAMMYSDQRRVFTCTVSGWLSINWQGQDATTDFSVKQDKQAIQSRRSGACTGLCSQVNEGIKRTQEMRAVFRPGEGPGRTGSGELLELVEESCRCAGEGDLWLCRGLTKKSVDKERGRVVWCDEKSRMALADLEQIRAVVVVGEWAVRGGSSDEFATGRHVGYWRFGALPTIGVPHGTFFPFKLVMRWPLSSKTPSGCAGTGSGVELWVNGGAVQQGASGRKYASGLCFLDSSSSRYEYSTTKHCGSSGVSSYMQCTLRGVRYALSLHRTSYLSAKIASARELEMATLFDACWSHCCEALVGLFPVKFELTGETTCTGLLTPPGVQLACDGELKWIFPVAKASDTLPT